MLAWPTRPDGSRILKPVAGGFALRASTLSGGPSIGRFEQVVPMFDDRWEASFTFQLVTVEQQLAMSSLLTGLRGRSGVIAVPAFSRRRTPWYVDPLTRRHSPRLVRNYRLDGTPYADAPALVNSLVTAQVLDSGGSAVAAADIAADAQATTLQIRVTQGGTLAPGMRFGISLRLYEIGPENFIDHGDGSYTVEIFPWLREAVDVGAPLDFVSPVCAMHLSTDDQGGDAMRSLDQMRFGPVSLSFIEAPETVESLYTGTGGFDFSAAENSAHWFMFMG